jgi:hypothetical protein
MKSLVCQEKSDLLSTYQEATLKYSEAVTQLNQNIGICAKARYDVFYGLAEEAGQFASEARRLLDKHVAGHGC